MIMYSMSRVRVTKKKVTGSVYTMCQKLPIEMSRIALPNELHCVVKLIIFMAIYNTCL